MPPRLELAGRRFGKLAVLSRSHKDKHHAWVWLCRCDCGTTWHVRGSTLAAGRTSSCSSCASTMASTTHGQTGTPLYQRWRAMLGRTQDPNHSEFHNYGGRGISVCERWLIFENFAADMGPTFSEDLTLDRIDVNGDYTPEHCRWATNHEQSRNKRTNHLVTWRGRTMTVQDWAELLGLKPNTVVHRLRRGWSVDRALSKDARPDALLQIANEVPADA